MATPQPTQCWCKDEKENEETSFDSGKAKSLFDEEEDYYEQYLEPLISELTLDPQVYPCGSTPSLPAVQVDTDRCEDGRMEIPWLQISLPPPGTLQIKEKKKLTPKRGPCLCWRMKEDLIDPDSRSKPVQVPDTICRCVGTSANVKTDQAGAGTAGTTDTPAAAPGDAAAAPGDAAAAPEGAAAAAEGTADSKPANADAKPEDAAAKPEDADAKPADAEAKPEDAAAKPEDAEAKPEGATDAKPEDATDAKPPEAEPKETARLVCPCPREEDDECKDIKTIMMLYDDPVYAGHEPYMDRWYHLYPDDVDSPCGPYTEIPWDELLIPRNIKLKGAMRKKKVCPLTDGCAIPGLDPGDPNTRALVRADKNEIVKCDRGSDQPDIAMNIEEILKQIELARCKCAPIESVVKTPQICKCQTTEPTSDVKVPQICKCQTMEPKPDVKVPQICTCQTMEPKSDVKVPQICTCPPMEPKSDVKIPQICKCFETGKIKPSIEEIKSPEKPKSKTSRTRQQKPSKVIGKRSKKQELIAVLDSCQAEMQPIKSALTELKAKIRALRQNKSREVEPARDICCGSSVPTFVPSPLGPSIPVPLPIPHPPFLPPPIMPLLPPFPVFPMVPEEDEEEGEIPTSKAHTKRKSPSFRSSPVPRNQKTCQKCKKKKRPKKEPTNSSTTSDGAKRRRARGTHRKDKKPKKTCKCAKRLAEKLTNTRRPDSNESKRCSSAVPTAERPQSGSAASKGLIIEECD